MENTSFFTKGDAKTMVSRVDQIHSITIYCPLGDFCVRSLKDTFEIMLPGYKTEKNLWGGVPVIDAFNAFLFTASFQEKIGLNIDKDIIGIIASSLKMFSRLKYISFQFTDDEEIMEAYKAYMKADRSEKVNKQRIYRVDMLEMNLCNMFSQNIIDMLNKVFMCNELIPNSYLNRRFVLDFTFDDYVSFMDMFIGNNKENLDILDKNICDYFKKFPVLIKEQKPMIRLVTNYRER